MSTREQAAQTARWPAFSLGSGGHLVWLVLSWGVPIALLAWSARLVLLEGYLLRAPGGFDGAFNKTVSGRATEFWDGTGLFYGPVFVLEYVWLIAPERLQLPEFARLDFVLFGASFVATWLAVFRALRPRLLLLVLGLWLAHHATVEVFANTAHLELLELACMCVALALAVRGRTTGAGASLGLAAATKMLPLVFFPYLALARKWRMLLAAVCVGGGLFLLACWVQGVSPWDGALMLADQKGNITKLDSSEYEYSITADLIRTFKGSAAAPTEDQARVAIALHRAISLVVGLAVAWLFWRTPIAGRFGWGLAFGLVAATMLVATPSSHIFYFVFLLPGWTAALALLVSRRLSRGVALCWLALVASYVMSGFDQPFLAAQRLFGIGGVVPQHWFDWHFPNLALLLALLVFGRLLRLSRSSP
jgi:Glycosyltransferase family 87